MTIDKYRVCRAMPKRITHRGMDFVLYPIQALKDFVTINNDVITKGDMGGYVANETNLEQDGACWIFPESYVFRDAIVSDNALVRNGAHVCGNAIVQGSAVLDGPVEVFGNAEISGYAQLREYAQVCGDAAVSGSARVREYAFITGMARISDEADIAGHAHVSGRAEVFGDAQVFGNAILKEAKVSAGLILSDINRDNREAEKVMTVDAIDAVAAAAAGAVKDVIEGQTGADARRDVLNLAIQAVCNDRNSTYGEPENVFVNIASLWAAYLKRELSPVDVANLMTLFKVARAQANPQHLDNFIDIAGYAACGADVRNLSPVMPVPMLTEENDND